MFRVYKNWSSEISFWEDNFCGKKNNQKPCMIKKKMKTKDLNGYFIDMIEKIFITNNSDSHSRIDLQE